MSEPEGIGHPIDPAAILRRKRSMRRRLLERDGLLPRRVAILGGSTTSEIRQLLELFLLDAGFRPEFYESDYARGLEDLLFGNPALVEFEPEIVYIHTSFRNLTTFPAIDADGETVERLLDAEFQRYRRCWDRAAEQFGCPIVQNNFELPDYRLTGNLDAVDPRGRTNFVTELNRRFANHAREVPGLQIHDLNYLAARVGLDHWYDDQLWHTAKYAMSLESMVHVAHSLGSMMRAMWGRASKCLVLDLDNTVWGGVIGDDGPEGIVLGEGDPVGEAHRAFQRYAKSLAARGIILAVCSKNEHDTALQGLRHRDCLLKEEDFATIAANWEPKSRNLEAIARTLMVGIDSLVFADDNPVERAEVRSAVPDVRVPELGEDPTAFIRIIDGSGWFETTTLSADDVKRGDFYRDNARREQQAAEFEDYESFLRSLEMVAEIAPWSEEHLPRITQLTNKTNQFNLTTHRCSPEEIRQMASDPSWITLYARLADRFGDNGLVGVTAGSIEGDTLTLDLWLMSCRVLRRGLEQAVFDELLSLASRRGVRYLRGRYIPTARNGLAGDHYSGLGFERVSDESDGSSEWSYRIPDSPSSLNTVIKVENGQSSDSGEDSRATHRVVR